MDVLSVAEHVAPIFSAVFLGATIIIALRSLRRSYHSPIFMKSIELKNDCDKRYEEINDRRYAFYFDNSNIAITEEKARQYFVRYWSLQASEFEFFLLGVVDPFIYTNWIIRKIKSFRETEIIPGWNAIDGWDKFGKPTQTQNSIFVFFIENLKVYSIMLHCKKDIDIEDFDIEFASDKISKLYNIKFSKDFRNSVTSRKKSWDAKELKDMYAQIRLDLGAGNGDIFVKFDPKIFPFIVEHEKKNIIGPALLEIIKNCRDKLDKSNNPRILDFGCGTFQIGKFLIDNGFEVEGYDPDLEALIEAQKKYGTLVHNRLFNSPNQVDNHRYEIVFLAFVHQVAVSKDSLFDLIKAAYKNLKKGGYLIILGNHPEFIGTPFSSMLMSKPKKSIDGAPYSGILYSDDGKEKYDLEETDHYFPLSTVQSIITSLGLSLGPINGISDKPSKGRAASDGTPYFILTAHKPI